MILDGREVSVVFSAWNTAATKTLNKVEAIDGSLQWEQISADSIDEININQCSISINAAESVEIRVRAISEAGYPLSPVKSEWSEILRVDFPDDLRDDNLQTTIDKNSIDLQNAEFDNILQQYGLLKHIQDSIKEAEREFVHHANNIASGQFTPEQKNIPVSTVITTMLTRLTNLETANASSITVSVIDFTGSAFQIQENTTVELFGGNYTDNLNILDQTTWGTIITKKFYIRLRNTSSIPVDIRSIMPGQFSEDVKVDDGGEDYYNVPVRIGKKQRQEKAQIVYFRNKDISGSSAQESSLVTDYRTWNNLTTPPTLVDPGVWRDPKTTGRYLITVKTPAASGTPIVHTTYSGAISGLNDGHIVQSYINANSGYEFVVYHQDVLAKLQNTTVAKELQRVAHYNECVAQERIQDGTPYILDNTYGFGFTDVYDRYLIGRLSCGAFLYPSLSDEMSIKVNGTTSNSSFIIPKESDVLIPIIWQYRMTDYLGQTFPQTSDIDKYDIEYSKTLGIDLLINQRIFKFDVRVTSRMKSKLTIKDTMNINPILTQYTNEAREILT
jgi:hypothetical protein